MDEGSPAEEIVERFELTRRQGVWSDGPRRPVWPVREWFPEQLPVYPELVFVPPRPVDPEELVHRGEGQVLGHLRWLVDETCDGLPFLLDSHRRPVLPPSQSPPAHLEWT